MRFWKPRIHLGPGFFCKYDKIYLVFLHKMLMFFSTSMRKSDDCNR